MHCVTVTGFWAWSAARPPTSDGRTRNIATPSLDAQVAAARAAALAVAGVDAGSVGVVEAHGTGTPVGDPIEFESLAQVYGSTGRVLLAGLGEVQLRPHRIRGGCGGVDQGNPRGCSTEWYRRWFTSTALPDALCRGSRPDCSCPQESTPWPTRRAMPGHAGQRCRPTGSPAPTCTPSLSRRPRPQSAGQDAATTKRSSAPCWIPCVLKFPRRTAAYLAAGWLTGWSQRADSVALSRPGLYLGSPARAPHGAHFGGRRRRQGVVCPGPAGRRRR